MKFIGFLLRIYSFLFHLLLGLFLLAIASLAASSHQPLNMGMLPFSDDNMVLGVFGMGMAALVSTGLAITRRIRFLFPIWAAAAVYLMGKGFLFGPYSFQNAQAFREAMWLLLAATVALVGAVWTLKARRGRL